MQPDINSPDEASNPPATSNRAAPVHCPGCRHPNQADELTARHYRCEQCGFELAHLDTTAQGTIRGVIGWVRAPGDVIAERYRVAALLGRGGFGVTYLVDDLRLHGKRRALKEIPTILFDEHETRLLGRLNHPAIPDITDRFVDHEMTCLVLEFGGSRTLRGEQRRRGGRIPLFALLPWLRQLCEAIVYLHSQDPPVIHRDLKPDNILLDDNDRVMLIDFGIAKEAVSDGATRTLGRAASQGFSPPEQVLGTGTDERSDVYSLGAIVYNLLTGAMPAAAHERVTGANLDPLCQLLPEIPPAVDAAVLKALELNINLRHASIAEFLHCFEQLQLLEVGAATMMLDADTPLSAHTSAPIPATTGSARLPSLRLPTAGTTANPLPGQPLPKSARRRVLYTGLALLAIFTGSGAGWWLLGFPGLESLDRNATGQSVEETSAESAAPVPTTTPETVQPNANANAQPPEPAADAKAVAAGAAAAAAGAAAAMAVRPDTNASSREPAKGQGTATNNALPSLFSNEQPSEPEQPARPKESLLDLFDRQRAQKAEATGATPSTQDMSSRQMTTSAPPATNQPDKPVATPKKPPKKKQASVKKSPRKKAASKKRTKPRVVTRKSPPKRKQSSSSAGSSGWGFKYKGAEKRN